MNYQAQLKQLKQLGLSDAEIRNILKQDFGLRIRPKERDRTALPEPPKAVVSKPHKNQAQRRLLPAQEQEFKKDYFPFIAARPNFKTDPQWRQKNTSLLFNLAKKVQEKKGLISILSIGEWGNLIKQLKEEDSNFSSYSAQQLLRIYLKHLIEYEFSLNGENLSIKEGMKPEEHICEANFSHGKILQLMNSPSKGLEMLMESLVVFAKGLDQLGVSYQKINLGKIQQQCGGQMIDIRIQNPLDYGFNINKLTNISFKMTIKEYCQYQKNYQSQSFKKSKYGQQLKNGKIFFGVNFQPENMSIFNQIWDEIDGGFLGFKQDFDLLSYLDDDIPGCSIPQFYLKVKGCWTGGHQQNVNMCAININHGPDPSEWYFIPYNEVQKLRKVLLEKFKCDIYKDEGLWFQKINWFIENGFSVKKILQQQGDIVVTGPGTLHWVRSHGVALQSAWNIFPKTFETFKSAIHRHQQNVMLKLQKRNVIPFKSLLLKFIDHELMEIQEKTIELVTASLMQWNFEQERLRLQLEDSCGLGFDEAIQQRLDDLASVCMKCRQEVFNYYVLNWDGDGIACLQCLSDNPDIHGTINTRLYYKYNSFQLKSLLLAAGSNQTEKKRWTNSRLCNGVHVGKVQCPLQHLDARSQGQQGEKQTKEVDVLTEYEKDAAIDKIEQLMTLSQSLPQNQRKTIRELIRLTNPNDFKEITNTCEVQVQTDEVECPICAKETQQMTPKPTKRHKYNQDSYNRDTQDNQQSRNHERRRSCEQKHQNQSDDGHRYRHRHSKKHKRSRQRQATNDDRFQRDSRAHKRSKSPREKPRHDNQQPQGHREHNGREKREDKDKRDSKNNRDHRDNRDLRNNNEDLNTKNEDQVIRNDGSRHNHGRGRDDRRQAQYQERNSRSDYRQSSNHQSSRHNERNQQPETRPIAVKEKKEKQIDY